jgi:hypothetical protein
MWFLLGSQKLVLGHLIEEHAAVDAGTRVVRVFV